MNLFLPLKKVWFYMTKSGEKREDYREITGYWCSRLLLYKGKHLPEKEWTLFLAEYFNPDDKESFVNFMVKHSVTTKPFSINIMTLGYPKRLDYLKVVKYKHNGIEVGYGYPKWGAELNKIYFIIKHGEEIVICPSCNGTKTCLGEHIDDIKPCLTCNGKGTLN